MSSLVEAYQRLPYPARVAVASGRGAWLGWWRYGRDSEDLVAEALQADTRPPAEQGAAQAERLAVVLQRAATAVPYYRLQWDERRRAGDRSPVTELANWPVLDKAAVKADPRAFVADDRRPERMFADHTSGTTGTPLTVWYTRATARRWYALFEARARRWHGVSRHDRWAILGGQPVVRRDQAQPPYWVWNPTLHQLYLSTYHLSERTAGDYADALRRYRVTHLVCYPSAVATLAGWLEPAPFPDLRVVLTNAETLTDPQREAVSAGLGVPVRDTWGQSEIVSAASECEHGTLHEWPEVGHTEILDDDGQPAAHGRLVATSLLNPDMPLVRYDIGDLGHRVDGDAAGDPCRCGRTLPRFGPIQGRADDVIVTPDGRHVGRLDPVFKADLPILEAQVIQESASGLRVLVVPRPGFGPEHEATILAGLRDRVGPMDVHFERVDQVPRGPNGKFRAVVSRVHATTSGSDQP